MNRIVCLNIREVTGIASVDRIFDECSYCECCQKIIIIVCPVSVANKAKAHLEVHGLCESKPFINKTLFIGKQPVLMSLLLFGVVVFLKYQQFLTGLVKQSRGRLFCQNNYRLRLGFHKLVGGENILSSSCISQ